jgi:hypothetical protein
LTQSHICSSYTSCELVAHHDGRGIGWGRKELYFSSSDMLGKHVEVMAHVVGGVCCSSGVPLGDMEECVASPEVLV